MADYFQVKNQNIFNPPANTSLGNATNQFNDVYVQNDLVLGNVTVTGDTIIAPRVTTITYPGDDTAADTAGGQTITLTGTGFVAGANILINGSAVGVVSVVSSTTITFTSPANATGSYVIYVINPDGSTAIAIPGIQYSGTPTWTTAAGTLGNVYETASFTQTVTATGDAPITYSVFSGSIPPGSTFNANGTITGTSQLSASPTTYSFTVRATDAQLQDTNRAFSISVIPDVVTWSSPTNNTTYSPAANIAIANITLSATSAVGSGITYSANTLPTGLSLTGANISGTPTVVASTSSLLTATANTTSESSSITINWVVSVASDPYFMYNSLLLPGTGTNGAQNNTFLDGSTNNFTITRNGNTTQGTFSPYGPNWSNYFDGSGDSLQAPSSASISGTGDFTAECWIYPTTIPGSYNIVGCSDTSGGLTMFGLNSNGTIFMGRSLIDVQATTSNSLGYNTWNHIAISRSSGTVRLFINGIQGYSGSITTNYNAGTVRLGTDGGGSSLPYTGYISNFRIITNSAIYTSNFTPSTTPLTAIANTALLTCQSNRFIDNSTNNFTITKNGDVSVQRFSPFSPTAAYSTSTIGGSGYFDGTTDYLSLSQQTALSFGTGDFTVEAWVYPTANPASYWSIMDARGFATTVPWAAGLRLISGNLKLEFYTGTQIQGSITVPLNTWTHIAYTRSGTTFKGFVNGVVDINTTMSTNLNIAAGTQYIGAIVDPTYNTGYMTDFRVVKGTAVYTSAFAPPTAPLTAVTNTNLLLNYTNAGVIDNSMMNNLETVGNAQISTAQTKFGSGSMYFDGTGDWLFLPANTTLALGSGDFTVEMWMYPNLTYASTYAGLLDSRTNADGAGLVYFGYTGTANQIGWKDNTTFVVTGTVTQSTWNHIAVVRSSGTMKLYINGTSVSTGANSTNYTVSFKYIATSFDPFSFNGYMDDFRITKGIARYTSNFTPATSAFPTY